MPLIVSCSHALLFVSYIDKIVSGPDGKDTVVKEAGEKYRLSITPVPTVIPDWCKDTTTFKSAAKCGWLQVYTMDEAVGATKSLGLQMANELEATTGGFAK